MNQHYCILPELSSTQEKSVCSVLTIDLLPNKSRHSSNPARFSTGPLTSALSVADQLQAVPNVVSETLPSPHPTNTSPLITPCSSLIQYAKRPSTCKTTCENTRKTLGPKSTSLFYKFWRDRLRHLYNWIQGRVAVHTSERKHASCLPTILYGLVQGNRIYVRPRRIRRLLLLRMRRSQGKGQLLKMAGSGSWIFCA